MSRFRKLFFSKNTRGTTYIDSLRSLSNDAYYISKYHITDKLNILIFYPCFYFSGKKSFLRFAEKRNDAQYGNTLSSRSHL